jgi:very-short-patch-repair endonuclease
MKYKNLSESKRKKILQQKYTQERKSFAAIAKELGTYANKIRRDAASFGIDIRTRSDAAKTAIEAGRSSPPMKGRQHTTETKLKISESQGEVWDKLNEEELLERSRIGKESWDQKSPQEKDLIIKKGSAAIREAARTGSKLEKFILKELTDRKFRVQFHKEHFLRNQKLEIDLFVEDVRAAIEIDGPSHFEPVWGYENLERNQRSDMEKTGLILDQGFVLIRIKQDRRSSQRYFRKVLDKLVVELEKIKRSFPDKSKRYIEI